jgi:iturin family lipopeptide synthetase A
MLATNSSHFHLTTWAMSGDSITAMKLATACRREGIAVRSVRFLTADTLADALPRPEVNAAR